MPHLEVKCCSYRRDERRLCFFVSPDLKIALAEQASKTKMQSLLLLPFPLFLLLTISTHVNDACEMNFKSDVLQLLGHACLVQYELMLL